jgi:hypothetical protein
MLVKALRRFRHERVIVGPDSDAFEVPDAQAKELMKNGLVAEANASGEPKPLTKKQASDILTSRNVEFDKDASVETLRELVDSTANRG